MGFRINSLNKLMDTRANKPRVTLLHYLVGEAEKENQDALNFVEELSPDLSKASKWAQFLLKKNEATLIYYHWKQIFVNSVVEFIQEIKFFCAHKNKIWNTQINVSSNIYFDEIDVYDY